MFMFKDKCPMCGTFGRNWNKEPEAFICPNCMSVFTEFGIIIDSENTTDDIMDAWS